MSEPFIAEIRMFAGNFAPSGWAFCNGQVLPIDQNTALFSLLGTTYGGDGRTTVGLPNLQGRAPMHPGRGPGLTARRLGEPGGSTTVTLSEAQIPSHSHSAAALSSPANTGAPTNAIMARAFRGPPQVYAEASTGLLPLGPVLSTEGGGQSHNNLQPYLAINFIIALVGLYPSRS
ncbi:MAG: tail fiber protein [Myxococcales bacterium]|nr:tail fiber protein [Myxococcales bacterium]